MTRRRQVVHLPVARVLAPLMQRIRALAAASEQVFFSDHARTRMLERDLTDVEVIRVLKLGEIDGQPWKENEGDDMACKVVMRHPGGRVLGVVTIVISYRERLFVKTVEWEDL